MFPKKEQGGEGKRRRNRGLHELVRLRCMGNGTLAAHEKVLVAYETNKSETQR